MSSIAIIGMACRYPEARSPRELWENVLAQRRSFRRIPQVRLRVEDYSAEEQIEDRIYLKTAAVLENYEFDRVRFQVSKESFESTDLVHWLALDVAAQALADAKLVDPSESQRERTGVYVGNSLTGEFSRANLLRLRWPYVRRVLAATLEKTSSFHNGDLHKLIEEIETLYKAPFPSTTEESLAGGLSNTIAGRICNYFNFKGAGYTVDAACASSLLAVITACSALESGDVDVAIAGGVDLSLDPFELAGFSKLGALATDKMRVFDTHSSGFWPGEGCGMVVLMRHEEAIAEHHSPYAVIRGWGISSDGSGGITRPELRGQLLALRRSYSRAGYGIDSVSYFEGHGTGTSVGDAVELQALSEARREAGANSSAALGSIKANIGHTKAAAGVAGLMKATMAVQARILPPTTGCDSPHAELNGERPVLRVLRGGELWPDQSPGRAGVSAMGFGGINTHVSLEATDTFRRRNFTVVEQQQLSSFQDCELFLFQASDISALRDRLNEVLVSVGEISMAEMADLASLLASELPADTGRNVIRAACVASSPDELEANLKKLLECCKTTDQKIDSAQGIFFGKNLRNPRIGFLFPGQGSPVHTHGAIWSRRFPGIRDLYDQAKLPSRRSVATEVAQPCVVAASLAGLHALELCGIQANIALGHSLGEITALSWAGACKTEDLLRIAFERGRIMAEKATGNGAMASVRASHDEVKKRINGDMLAIAACNSPLQTVVSGEAKAVRQFSARLTADGITTTLLPVSHAFHSPLVTEVASAFCEYLAGEQLCKLNRRVVSTVTASWLKDDEDLRRLLTAQITSPVRFVEALQLAASEAELFIEVGPGAVLSGVVAECTNKPAISLNVGSESLRGLFLATGAAFALGAEMRTRALFKDRFVRPFDIKRKHTFLKNPCETVCGSLPVATLRSAPARMPEPLQPTNASTAIDVLRNLIAQRTELPLATIRPESRFLDDLHLSSIAISQIILQAAAQLNVSAPAAPTEYANATIAEAAQVLEATQHKAPARAAEKFPSGVEPWIRALAVEFVEQECRQASSASQGKWEILNSCETSLSTKLEQEFKSASGSGVVCLAPSEHDESTASYLLSCAQKALKHDLSNIVFVGAEAGPLARTLYLEHPNLRVTVVEVPPDHPQAAQWIAHEARAASAFTEAQYDSDGIRREPRLKLLWPEKTATNMELGRDDVLLVTGGGRGIAAECALELARESGCRLALVGRSGPASDPELGKNLCRFADAGVSFRYFVSDISNPVEANYTLRQIATEMGAVTAMLHGAGVNHPKRLEEITNADLRDTFAPKVTGLKNILDNIDPAKLRLLVTFGSIIARTGLHGEAHYGMANDHLKRLVERWQKEHPPCRCLNLEWSVWAGAGMGHRLGVLDSLIRQGITPLPLDDAIRTLKTMLRWKEAPVSCIVTGRFGKLPTIRLPERDLPLRRFLEHTQIYYPGIELIAEAELSVDTDPYISEHVFQGEQLLPAVCGIEAMAQLAMALEETEQVPQFEQLRFDHPIVIPRNKSVRIRVAALRRQPGVISVVIRCDTTSFQIDHFSGECIFNKPMSAPEFPASTEKTVLALDSSRDLYGRILFHQGRFRRVEKYLHLQATESVAQLRPPAVSPWYARHLPSDFVAGDAASRDAALHSIQACIPHKTILPVGVDRIVTSAEWTQGCATVQAVERLRDGDNFVYDLRIQDAHGQDREFWQGLRLRAVAPTQIPICWPLPLLGPYLERKAGELAPFKTLKAMLRRTANDEQIASLVRQMAGSQTELTHRPDGKPEIVGSAEIHVSISHSGCIALMVSANRSVGCDLEAVRDRDRDEWEQLLGKDGVALAEVLAEKSQSPISVAATQVWTLKESLRKVGASLEQSLYLESVDFDKWTMLSGGRFVAVTFRTSIAQAEAGEYAFSFVIEKTQ